MATTDPRSPEKEILEAVKYSLKKEKYIRIVRLEAKLDIKWKGDSTAICCI